MSSILKVDQLKDSGGNAIITSNGSGTFTSSLPNTGITMADQWRVTSAASFSTSGADITANLEQVDTTGQGTIGTAMTESSGIFSFPQTGIYKIDAQFSFYLNGDTRWIYSLIKGTTDNSTYNNLSANYHFIQQTGGTTTYTGSYVSTLFDVTDTSNCKVKFHVDTSSGTTYYYADTNINITCFTFTRLGDT
jgi:hypothetical protein|tara:strand:- start:214 stop:789 length:576 start_codon:yes stop_codon:yes gene_type:complete